MSLCINPNCPHPDNGDSQLFCQACGSELLIVGRYRVLRLLSDKGGFGNTYEVSHNQQHKVLKLLTNDHPKAIELFQKEAQVLSQLNHPGIPKGAGEFRYFARGSSKPIYCLIMQKIEGMDLEEYQKQRQNRPIDQSLALEWLLQITQILQEVHGHNFFHRDIKPSNIILQGDGQLALIDFGAVRQVTATIISGQQNTGIFTPGFAPPEQEKGYAVPQSDFYALGRTFVYLLTGKNPTDPDIYDRYNDSLNWRTHAPSVLPEFADFIDFLMADKANQRPQNTEIILEHLQQLQGKIIPSPSLSPDSIPPTIATEKKTNSPISTGSNLSNLNRRKWLKFAGLTTGGILLSVGVGKWLVDSSQDSINGTSNPPSSDLESQFKNGDNFTVSQGGDGNFSSLSEAVKNSAPYSVITVKPGVYQEEVIVNKPLKIIGEGEASEIIVEVNQFHCLGMKTSSAIVRNMTFNRQAGSEDQEDYAINIAQGTLILEDCIVTSQSLACIGIHGDNTTPEIRRCFIHSSFNGSGLYFYGNAQGLVEDCDIYNNTLSGVAISDNSDPKIYNCKIYNCEGNGVYVYEKGRGTVEKCQIYGNALSGISIHKESNPYIYDCTIYDGGIFIYEESTGTIEKCKVIGTTIGAGIEIREGGNPSIYDCQVYDGNNSGIYVHNLGYGTIENCEIYNNSIHGVFIKNEGNPLISKCQIRNNSKNGILVSEQGLGSIEGSDIFQNLQIGVEIENNSNLTLKNCQINQNKKQGIYVYNNAQATVENCDLTNNELKAIEIDNTSTVKQKNNQI